MAALSIRSPPAASLSWRPPHGLRSSPSPSTSHLLLLLGRWNPSPLSTRTHFFSSSADANRSAAVRASSDERVDGVDSDADSNPSLLDEQLLRRASAANDADQALEMIAEARGSGGPGVIENQDCHSIIEAAFDRGDADLALSVFYAMRAGFDRGVKVSSVERWTWARPDVRIYALMVQRLTASLRVSDAIRMISYVSRMGVSSGEEVPFGMVVRCPSCMVAVAVVQPQHGIQVASCSQCRYQYELVSGDIVNIESEEISIDISAWEKVLRFLQINKDSIPAALHSIVLPQRLVDVVALKQQLLSQYDLLQDRIKELRQAAEREVWMLARLCQLENKIVAVGEPSYRARRSRVKRVRKSLESSLLARIELIESYAKLSSMIEIEVEMDSDVLAAEAVSNAESIAQQIQQIMEIENLEERWRLQAEANDEVERLLGSQPASTELV